jgi:putative ABC transport system permease protein
MFKNYLKIAFRNLRKNPGYSFINIFGLAAGLACFIMILLYVQHEFSYDKFYTNSDQIYRVVQRQPGNIFLGSDRFAVTPAPLANTLVAEYPEVTAATTIRKNTALLSRDEYNYYEKALHTDNQFFEVFRIPGINTSTNDLLSEPNTMVLTESLAVKIFGNENPVGQTLLYENNITFTVTGVIPDPPVNSILQYSFLSSLTSFSFDLNNFDNNWDTSSYHTFFTLADGANAAQLQEKMPALVQKYVAEDDQQTEEHNQYIVQALTDIHLGSFVNFDISDIGSITYVYLFSTIALVILLLACINYTNLAIAQSIRRAREVGLRKVIGANKAQLVGQFLGESMLMSVFALVLALILAELFLPVFGNLVERPLSLNYKDNGFLIPGLLLFMVVIGLASGSYPSLFMASLKPIRTLQGKVKDVKSKFGLQQILITAQYTATIALITCGFVIYQQMQFVHNKDTGYDRDHVLTFQPAEFMPSQQYQTFREELLRNPNIQSVSTSSALPVNIEASSTINDWEGSSDDAEVPVYQIAVDYSFLEVFGIELAAGRSFSRDIAGDAESGYLINETAARALGWNPEEAVGKYLSRGEDEKTVIGVVKDFHMHSMHLAIQPLMIGLNTDIIGYVSAKISPENVPQTIHYVNESYAKISPYPLDYSFLDQKFEQLYNDDERLGHTFVFFAVLALIIASLGLFGLAAYAAEQRTKEIGVRKVLGATVTNILTLLSTDFLKLVVFGFLIAIPISWYGMNQWLADFAYRIDIGPGIFALSGATALVIALLTVSRQSIKAALTNPVDSLRRE